MGKLAIVTVVIAAAASPLIRETSYAAEGPWCHTFGGATASIENCSIQSLEMCRFEIQGNGGSCSPNPRWHGNLAHRKAAPPAGLYPRPWQ